MKPGLCNRRALLRQCLGAGFGFAAGRAQAAKLPEAQVEAALRYAAAQLTQTLFIQQHGRVLLERGLNGGSAREARRIYSGTKGFWGLAALAAVEDGLLALDEPVSATLPEWRRGAKASVTLRQLLDFTGGLERCLRLHEDGLADRNRLALARPLLAAPGRSFIYGPSQLQVFHEVLKRRLASRRRPQTPVQHLEKRVLRPLGLGPQRYLPDAAGNPLLAAGFILTARQWARVGDLLVGRERSVLSPDSLALLRRGSAANPAYAFGFWNNRAAAADRARESDVEALLDRDWQDVSWQRVCLCRAAPADLLAGVGSAHQRLFAIPSQGLVVVRQGLDGRFADGEFLRRLLGAA